MTLDNVKIDDIEINDYLSSIYARSNTCITLDKFLKIQSHKYVLSSFWKRRVTLTSLIALSVKTNGKFLRITLLQGPWKTERMKQLSFLSWFIKHENGINFSVSSCFYILVSFVHCLSEAHFFIFSPLVLIMAFIIITNNCSKVLHGCSHPPLPAPGAHTNRKTYHDILLLWVRSIKTVVILLITINCISINMHHNCVP